MSEGIIIDGINVAECDHLNKVFKEEPYCDIDEEHLYTCSSDTNCYYKQLKRLQDKYNTVVNKFFNSETDKTRLQKENKKLKEVTNEAKIEYENLLINRNDFAERAYKLERENKELKKYQYTQEYLQSEIEKRQKALEEIRNEIGDLKDINKLINLQKILDVINEVLNDRD